MITDLLLNGIWIVVSPFLSVLPSMTFNPASVDGAMQYVRAACYFLPMGTVKAILFAFLTYWAFKAIIAVIKTLLSVIPVL